MNSVPHGMQRNIVLVAGETLTVTGGGRAGVWQRSDTGGPATLLASLTNAETITRGPYSRDIPFRLDAVSGPITWSTVDPLQAGLQRATTIIASAANIATALNSHKERPAMTSTTKGARTPTFAAIPGALDKLRESLEVRGQRVLERIERTEFRGALVESKATAFLDATDAGLDEQHAYFDQVEAAIGDNGAPLGGAVGSK